MSKETYEFALENALSEIRNVCPEVQSSFILNKEAELIAGDKQTVETTLDRAVGSLEGIMEKADAIGDLDALTIEGSKGNVHITCINDMYLTIISSRKADVKYVQTIARVLIPTVMKLLDSLSPTPLRQSPPSRDLLKPEIRKELEKEIVEEEFEDEAEAEETKKDKEKRKKRELEIPSNQLIVERFGGLLVRSDTVQISRDIVSEWQDVLDTEEIGLVEIESFNGKSNQCKVKALDGSKLENKAVIRIPEKLCQTLGVKKGELVRVTPVIN
ncbi:MAG: roadblock/LC7 domain-containing protein [Candidatus Bathyarchaeota archaeon]|nr:MAG: roadblock/LC7 domain-containing protein [Candidatus Bathyarchaeota archaeon]